MTPEERELAALVGQAFELKGSPYLLDACAAIAEWHDRRHIRRFERRQRERAVLVQLLHETDPSRRRRQRAA